MKPSQNLDEEVLSLDRNEYSERLRNGKLIHQANNLDLDAANLTDTFSQQKERKIREIISAEKQVQRKIIGNLAELFSEFERMVDTSEVEAGCKN